MMKDGEKLKQLRKEKGLSQRSLANEIKVSNTLIHKFEKGESTLGPENMLAVCKYFKVKTNFFKEYHRRLSKKISNLNKQFDS